VVVGCADVVGGVPVAVGPVAEVVVAAAEGDDALLAGLVSAEGRKGFVSGHGADSGRGVTR
jgi:hypothetical protein